MGGERSSTTWKRQQGMICTMCRNLLDPPERPGERLCAPCMAERDASRRRRVYVSYTHAKGGWRCGFLEEDCKTALPKKLLFADAQKVRDMVKRGGGCATLEDVNMLEHGISIGRGGAWLSLTPVQYGRLKLR